MRATVLFPDPTPPVMAIFSMLIYGKLFLREGAMGRRPLPLPQTPSPNPLRFYVGWAWPTFSFNFGEPVPTLHLLHLLHLLYWGQKLEAQFTSITSPPSHRKKVSFAENTWRSALYATSLFINATCSGLILTTVPGDSS